MVDRERKAEKEGFRVQGSGCRWRMAGWKTGEPLAELSESPQRNTKNTKEIPYFAFFAFFRGHFARTSGFRHRNRPRIVKSRTTTRMIMFCRSARPSHQNPVQGRLRPRGTCVSIQKQHATTPLCPAGCIVRCA